MFRTTRSRAAFAITLGCLFVIFGAATLGYFVGFTGYGSGWSGFYVGLVVGISALISAAILMALFGIVMRWVFGAEKYKDLKNHTSHALHKSEDED